MELTASPRPPVDLTTTPLHLGRGSVAYAMSDFSWDAASLEAYTAASTADGDEGRMVMVFDQTPGPANHWERHPAGDEVVLCISGRLVLTRELDDGEDRVELGPGVAAINARNVWHRTECDEPTRFLTITPGLGTDHRSA